MRDEQDAERLHPLILPEDVVIGLDDVRDVVRIRRAADNRNAKIVATDAVAVLGIVDDGQSVGGAGDVHPALAGVFVPVGFADEMAVGELIGRLGGGDVHRERELQDFLVFVPVERDAGFEFARAA